MRRRGVLTALMVVACLFLTVPLPAAQAQTSHPPTLPFVPDCKDAPVPSVPGHGLASFFSSPPDPLPAEGDPFAEGSKTTIFGQYGLAAIRFNNYDLGCGPDAARDPGAVIGTSISNWTMQLPVALTALTGSLTRFAFQPTFLGAFDPVLVKVSSALHGSLFETWLPAVLVILGIAIIAKARRAALATTAAAIGWSLLVVLLATALFRWPVQAGHIADETVTGTLGSTVNQLDGNEAVDDPGLAVASQVEEAVLYRAWLAGTLGSATSPTAEKYGPQLLAAQSLTWREARQIERHPASASRIIEAKQDKWTSIADEIKDRDPEAYEYLTGRRSEARIGYTVMATIATFLALPFLLLSALLLLGCYMIVRLGVMMFPAFATLGAFPAARGVVIGLGRVIGAAVVNSIIFGIGAAVTVMVLGLLFAPGNGTPAWLGLVLMPLFTYVMWKALRPFRRLTEMVSPNRDHFGSMAGVGEETRQARRFLRSAASTAAGALVARKVADRDGDEDEDQPSAAKVVPYRAEAQSTPEPTPQPAALEAARPGPDTAGPEERSAHGASQHHADADAASSRSGGAPPNDFVPTPTGQTVADEPIEPEWIDGEEVYAIYRPPGDPAVDRDDAAPEPDHDAA